DPRIVFVRGQGTSSCITAVLSQNPLLTLVPLAFNGTSYGFGGSFRILANENWTNAAMGTFAQVGVVPTGTTSAVESVRFMSNGGLQIIGPVTTNPVVGDIQGANQGSVIMYVKNGGGKLTFAYKNASGTISYLSATLDASTTTWTNTTTAP